MRLTVDYLNHASVLLRIGEHRLLCDPWYSGTAFSGGWGLRYDNPQAMELALQATHLWISHWHSDHMHVPTLQALAQQKPKLRVLANTSANFSTAERLRSFGFRDVIELHERTPLSLGDAVSVVRYPTAGVDNMLHVRAHGWSIVNYNDCNLRPRALRMLASKLGKIDLLLTNYNHAGKLFEPGTPLAEKQKLWQALTRVIELLSARHVLPFASSHYYRVAGSRSQNQSLLSFDDLEQRATTDDRLTVLRIGDSLCFEDRSAPAQYLRRAERLPAQPEQLHDYGASVPWQQLLDAATTRCDQLRRGFPLANLALPALQIAVTDHGRVLGLDLLNGPSERHRGTTHITAHSRALYDWLGRRFGDDSFIAGAHFELCGEDPRIMKLWTALSLLDASKLSARDALDYLRSREGLRFLWCRREEILATLTAGSLQAGEMRS
jgi:L-ascorbate metabolism protein UlaG (beta-lactamase superfamily)